MKIALIALTCFFTLIGCGDDYADHPTPPAEKAQVTQDLPENHIAAESPAEMIARERRGIKFPYENLCQGKNASTKGCVDLKRSLDEYTAALDKLTNGEGPR